MNVELTVFCRDFSDDGAMQEQNRVFRTSTEDNFESMLDNELLNQKKMVHELLSTSTFFCRAKEKESMNFSPSGD
jgi:hypothetical protein